MTKQVLIEATGDEYVGYFGIGGQIDLGYPVEEDPAVPPVGTVYEREYTLLTDVTTDDGEVIDRLDGFPLKVGPRTFLRGMVVTGRAAAKLLLSPFLAELISLAEESGGKIEVMGDAPPVVAITTADGTEVGILLGDKDTAPPEGASSYPVGESPEEVAEADAEADAEWEDFDDDLDEVERIREDAKDGVYDEDSELVEDVGGGPTRPPS